MMLVTYIFILMEYVSKYEYHTFNLIIFSLVDQRICKEQITGNKTRNLITKYIEHL
jgi:hypothetical protein